MRESKPTYGLPMNTELQTPIEVPSNFSRLNTDDKLAWIQEQRTKIDQAFFAEELTFDEYAFAQHDLYSNEEVQAVRPYN